MGCERQHRAWPLLLGLLLLTPLSGCSMKQYAVNMIGDMLVEGGSVYESDDDLVLVGEALPFGIKLLETLLAESPENQGLLLGASRAYVLYTYAYVQHEVDVAIQDDVETAKRHRQRARKLYLRAHAYAMRAMEASYPGIESRMVRNPVEALSTVGVEDDARDVAMLYWSAASLGLAISVSKHEPALLARLPEIEAMLHRALALDESWDSGTLHEFAILWAGARPGTVTPDALRRHYERALELSAGRRAGVHVAYAEAVSVPAQDRTEFIDLMRQALAVDPDGDPDHRLLNAIARRRAAWLLARVDDLILE